MTNLVSAFEKNEIQEFEHILKGKWKSSESCPVDREYAID